MMCNCTHPSIPPTHSLITHPSFHHTHVHHQLPHSLTSLILSRDLISLTPSLFPLISLLLHHHHLSQSVVPFVDTYFYTLPSISLLNLLPQGISLSHSIVTSYYLPFSLPISNFSFLCQHPVTQSHSLSSSPPPLNLLSSQSQLTLWNTEERILHRTWCDLRLLSRTKINK